MPCFLSSISFSFASPAQKAQPPTLLDPRLLPHLHRLCTIPAAAAAAPAKAINHGSCVLPRLPPQARVGMGNVASGVQIRRRRLSAVEERLTRPRRLVRELPDLDAGRLHRLIRGGDLAPCFDAAEDAGDGQAEECPICFYFYPSLNKSKCCGKGICTECFLQLMPSKTSKAVHCPFCKAKSYAIEYQGAQTTSEKKSKQEGEQNVSEIKLRVHSKFQMAREISLR